MVEQLPVVDDGDDQPFMIARKNRDDSEMDITPMIDIVFLLLIFFLVASKMEEAAAVTLPPAKHGDPVREQDAVVILVVKASGDRVAVKRWDGQPFSEDLAQQEQEIADYVDAGLNGASPFTEAKSLVMIKAAKGVKHREVARVAKAVGRAQDATPLMHIAVLETQ